MKRVITDVPEAKLAFVVASLKADNPLSISKEKQDDGRWTVIGEFPDSPPSPGEALAGNGGASAITASSGHSQSGTSAAASAVDTLARTLWGEARGETKVGREAVASVVVNRLKKPSRFGASIEEVCRKADQFSCWNSGDLNRAQLEDVDASNPVFAECLAIAQAAAQGLLADSVLGADHYHATGVTPHWAQGKTPCITIGQHLFYNDIA